MNINVTTHRIIAGIKKDSLPDKSGTLINTEGIDNNPIHNKKITVTGININKPIKTKKAYEVIPFPKSHIYIFLSLTLLAIR
ncbi:MAG: hypothetical protein GX066_02370 [Clostridiaceae bacterium]|nr:hypothetical protein [Clostridiaceae bacterium]